MWEPGNNRRVVVPRPGPLSSSSVSSDDLDLVLGLIDGGDEDDDQQPDAQLVETSGGNTMVKLTTTYTAAFGEYLKVVGGPVELGAWDAGAAPALTWGDGDVWTATLELPAGTHEFKVGTEGHTAAAAVGVHETAVWGSETLLVISCDCNLLHLQHVSHQTVTGVSLVLTANMPTAAAAAVSPVCCCAQGWSSGVGAG